jgi:hypothetical protein
VGLPLGTASNRHSPDGIYSGQSNTTAIHKLPFVLKLVRMSSLMDSPISGSLVHRLRSAFDVLFCCT